MPFILAQKLALRLLPFFLDGAFKSEPGFSLSNAPLMRMALFQLSKAQYYLVWSHHHLLLDGWCNGIIMQEVFRVYQTLCEGKEPNLPPSPPYKDYIAWLNQKNEVAAKNFWKLSDFEQSL